jgi:hypothetical protein
MVLLSDRKQDMYAYLSNVHLGILFHVYPKPYIRARDVSFVIL